jgi:hypothetical protein
MIFEILVSKKNKMTIEKNTLANKLIIIISKKLSESDIEYKNLGSENPGQELLSNLSCIRDKLVTPGQDWSCYPYTQTHIHSSEVEQLSALIRFLEKKPQVKDETIEQNIIAVEHIIRKYKTHACLHVLFPDIIIGLQTIPLLLLFGKLKSLDIPKLNLDELDKLKSEFIKIKTALKPKIQAGGVGVLYLVYTVIFAVSAVYIQTLLFGAILLGGNILTNLLFGMIVAAIITPAAITILQIKSNISSNKLFYLLLFGFIFAAFTFMAPTISFLLLGVDIYTVSIIYSLIFGLMATIIAHNMLNLINPMLEILLPSIIFNKLLFVESLIIELLLSLLFIPVGDLLLKIGFLLLKPVQNEIIADITELNIIECLSSLLLMLSLYFILMFLMPNTYVSLMPILVIIIELFIMYNVMFGSFINQFLVAGQVAWPRWHNGFVEFFAEIFTRASDFIAIYLDKSIAITSRVALIAQNISDVYRSNILVELYVPKTNIIYLNYFLTAITFILQIMINLVSFLIFIILYPIYKIAELIAYNMQNLGKEYPAITTLFFITAVIVYAAFSSPIQLFVLGNIVMSGSAVMNILFGIMASLVSTILSANACMVTDNYVKPLLLSAFNNSCETFTHFHNSIDDFCGMSDSAAPKK